MFLKIHFISINIKKYHISSVYRQNDGKRFVAVDINRLNRSAIIYLQPLHFLVVHGEKSALVISFDRIFRDIFVNSA